MELYSSSLKKRIQWVLGAWKLCTGPCAQKGPCLVSCPVLVILKFLITLGQGPMFSLCTGPRKSHRRSCFQTSLAKPRHKPRYLQGGSVLGQELYGPQAWHERGPRVGAYWASCHLVSPKTCSGRGILIVARIRTPGVSGQPQVLPTVSPNQAKH